MNNRFFNFFRSIKLLSVNNLNTISRLVSKAPKFDNPTPLLRTQDTSYVLKAMTADQFYKSNSRWPIQTIDGDPAIFNENPKGWYESYKHNEFVGSCASIPKGRNTAWMGYYYVEPQYRNRGYGKMMFERLLDHDKSLGITHHSFVCLENLAPMYRTIGFEISFQDVIFHTQPSSNITPSASKVMMIPMAMSQALYNELMEYDKSIHLGYNRESFLMPWISKKYTQVIIAMEHDKIVGYNVISDFMFPLTEGSEQIHQRMAPVYADDAEIAELLISAGLELKTKPCMFIDADGGNPNALSVVSKFKFFKEAARLARMSRPEAPEYYNNHRVYSPSYYGNGP